MGLLIPLIDWMRKKLNLIFKLLLVCAVLTPLRVIAADPIPLHQQIDTITSRSGASDLASTDSEFLRRVYLDFAGDLPTVAETRKFLSDKSPDKRTKLIDQLLNDDRHVEHLADQFNIFLMERQGENPHWRKWLETAIKDNRPWDQMVREIIRADCRDEPNRGATFFISKRLEKYGQNPTDYPGLTRDVGRMFLGIDLQCAECHNHLTVDHYKQADFQGMFVTFQNLKLHGGEVPTVEEKVMEGPWEYASVFSGKKRNTGPRIPGLEEITVQTFDKDEAYEVAPDKKTKLPGIPKFSPLTLFSEQISSSPTFAPNIANRIWFSMIGEGIVEPLDLHHPDNPPSDPKLMKLLSDAFVDNGYDIKHFLREISLTKIYQRTGIAPEKSRTEDIALAIERRLSAEQLYRTFISATQTSLDEEKGKNLKEKFVEAFSNEPKQPELEFAPSLKGTLMLLNDAELVALLAPKSENLAAQLSEIEDDSAVTERLFLQVFTRFPSERELEETTSYLKESAANREEAITNLIWAMLTSAEFATNH